MNYNPKKRKNKTLWHNWSMKTNSIKYARTKGDILSIAKSESQRGMRRDILTNGLRAKTIMSNEVLVNL